MDVNEFMGSTTPPRLPEPEAALQHGPAARVVGLPTSGSGGVRARLRRLAGCATPTGFAGQALASAKTNPELTFNPDHPVGADHGRTQYGPIPEPIDRHGQVGV